MTIEWWCQRLIYLSSPPFYVILLMSHCFGFFRCTERTLYVHFLWITFIQYANKNNLVSGCGLLTSVALSRTNFPEMTVVYKMKLIIQLCWIWTNKVTLKGDIQAIVGDLSKVNWTDNQYNLGINETFSSPLINY